MKPPNWERADIDPPKLRDYLVASTHPVGRFKARFFESLGYTRDNWQVLHRDLRKFASEMPARPAGRNDYGEKYKTSGRLAGPRGSGAIVTVWIVLYGEEIPRFVTAYPGEDA